MVSQAAETTAVLIGPEATPRVVIFYRMGDIRFPFAMYMVFCFGDLGERTRIHTNLYLSETPRLTPASRCELEIVVTVRLTLDYGVWSP